MRNGALSWMKIARVQRDLFFFLSLPLNGNGESYDFDLWAALHFRALEISVLWSRGLSCATGNGLRSAITVVVMPSNNDTAKKKKHKSRGTRSFFKRAPVSLRYRVRREIIRIQQNVSLITDSMPLD